MSHAVLEEECSRRRYSAPGPEPELICMSHGAARASGHTIEERVVERESQGQRGGASTRTAPGQNTKPVFTWVRSAGARKTHDIRLHQWRPSLHVNSSAETELKEIISSPDPPLLTPEPPCPTLLPPWPSSPYAAPRTLMPAPSSGLMSPTLHHLTGCRRPDCPALSVDHHLPSAPSYPLF